jgi:hypothetical protein
MLESGCWSICLLSHRDGTPAGRASPAVVQKMHHRGMGDYAVQRRLRFVPEEHGRRAIIITHPFTQKLKDGGVWARKWTD